ncbi:MAG: RDD family protein [bacterium]
MHSIEEQSNATGIEFAPVSLLRRLGAILYDGIMLICIIFLAWQPVPLLPDDAWPQWLSQGVRLTYLFAVAFLFFGWFWTHGGQTIGMRAWKIRLINCHKTADSDANLSWVQAFIRFGVALFSWAALGFGFLWAVTNRKRLCWHDIASNSMLARVK